MTRRELTQIDSEELPERVGQIPGVRRAQTVWNLAAGLLASEYRAYDPGARQVRPVLAVANDPDASTASL
jgi:hypothetical protein